MSPSIILGWNKRMNKKVEKTDEQWKRQLDSEQYYVTRQAGTERPFTGKYTMHFEDGSYTCVCCGETLFDSASKYDHGCGWPSFSQAKNNASITEKEDNSLGMRRVEILCSACDAHLGHVFPDGPKETGLRYCINSASLDFKAQNNDD